MIHDTDKIAYLEKYYGIDIEVYLGLDDKIINPKKTADFFRKYCEVYVIKNLQHNLCNF